MSWAGTVKQPRLKNEEGLQPLLILLVLAAFAWIAYAAIAFAVARRLEQAGQFGDMLGGFNALVTAFAFAALVFTVHLQRRELSYQREELELTRVELSGQKEALQIQNALSRIQAFESTFFQLLRLYHEIVAAVEMIPSHGQSTLRGRASFTQLRTELRAEYNSRAALNQAASDELEFLDAGYETVYTRYQAAFGHCFRHLYHLFLFVAESDIADKRRYARFARAQLSTDELVCIFYNCVSRHGREKFKPLAERFSLFDNLDPGQLHRGQHANHMAPRAFRSSDAV